MDQACFHCQFISALSLVVFHSFRELCYSTEYTKSNAVESVKAKYVNNTPTETGEGRTQEKTQLAKNVFFEKYV